MTPGSQRYRQITFSVTGGLIDLLFTFNLRPEELHMTWPVRGVVQQTLGGSRGDVFGEGLPHITLQGHNGWRGGLLEDGETMFSALKQTVYDGWLEQRRAMSMSGQDPSQVKLVFSDSLNGYAYEVQPQVFELRRSRSRPLLMMYDIQMTAVADATTADSLVDDIINAISNPARFLFAITGLQNSVAMVQNYYENVTNLLGATASGLGSFLTLGQNLFSTVSAQAQSLEGQFSGVASQVLQLGYTFAQAGANALAILATDSSLDPAQRISFSAVSGAFVSAACAMKTGFDTDTSFLIFDGLNGASGCSSTAGGDPANAYTIAGLNPLNDIFPAQSSPVSITAESASALSSLMLDPIYRIGETTFVNDAMLAASEGITLS